MRGGGEGGGECEEDQNSSISLHVSEMFTLLGAFTPEMPITLSFLDSVLYEIQNKETKKKKEREREREREKRKSTLLTTSYPKKRERERKEKVHFWPLLIQLKDIFH